METNLVNPDVHTSTPFLVVPTTNFCLQAGQSA